MGAHLGQWSLVDHSGKRGHDIEINLKGKKM